MTPVSILGTGVAVAQEAYSQQRIREVLKGLYADVVPNLDRLLDVFSHSHIQQRYLVRPPEWYAQNRGFEEQNQVYVESAVELSVKAATEALSVSGVSADNLAGIVVASTTGLATPSIDVYIAQALGMQPSAKRLPIFGLGCAAGVSGLARTSELSKAGGGKPWLFVAVEICSVTFQKNDTSKSNLVGSSLFSDGAAAVVVGGNEASNDKPSDDKSRKRGIDLIESHSELFVDTHDIMGWDFLDSGFKVRFHRDIPVFVEQHLPRVLDEAYSKWNVRAEDIVSFVTHPGGAKVLDAFQAAVGGLPALFEDARYILANYGNMSSASVLFVLDHAITTNSLTAGYALMSALGPGFSSEFLLLAVNEN